MTGSWTVFALWGVVVLVFVGIWVSFADGLVRAARAIWHPRGVAAFARANGWSYEFRGWRPLRPGPPLWSATSAACSDVVTGISRGVPFVAYEYAHQAQVVSLKLPMSLPLLEVRPQGLDSGTTVTVPNVTLESEAFNRRFWVHAEDPKFASDVLHPRLMQALLAAPPLCWRIWDDDLYGWWPGEPAPARILLYLAVLHRIRDEVPEYVWHDHGLAGSPSS